MSKHNATGVLRQSFKRKAKLEIGDKKLSKYERFVKSHLADLDAIAKETK